MLHLGLTHGALVDRPCRHARRFHKGQRRRVSSEPSLQNIIDLLRNLCNRARSTSRRKAGDTAVFLDGRSSRMGALEADKAETRWVHTMASSTSTRNTPSANTRGRCCTSSNWWRAAAARLGAHVRLGDMYPGHVSATCIAVAVRTRTVRGNQSFLCLASSSPRVFLAARVDARGAARGHTNGPIHRQGYNGRRTSRLSSPPRANHDSLHRGEQRLDASAITCLRASSPRLSSAAGRGPSNLLEIFHFLFLFSSPVLAVGAAEKGGDDRLTPVLRTIISFFFHFILHGSVRQSVLTERLVLCALMCARSISQEPPSTACGWPDGFRARRNGPWLDHVRVLQRAGIGAWCTTPPTRPL